MDKLLPFSFIAYDTKTLSSGSIIKTLDFFKDVNEYAPSVTEYIEIEITKRFFDIPEAKELLYKELCVSNDFSYKLNFQTSNISNYIKKPGDIDIIICDKNKPQEPIAIEVKIFKAKLDENGEANFKGRMTRNFKKGVEQANGLKNIRFYNSYLLLLIEVDGRDNHVNNLISRNLNNRNFKKIYNFPYKENLCQDVGIIYIEVIQPTDSTIERTGMIAINIERKANKIIQPSDLSTKINNLFKTI